MEPSVVPLGEPAARNDATRQRGGSSATILAGAPVPPSIFIGSAASRNPVGGKPGQVRDVLQVGHAGRGPDPVGDEVGGPAVVDAGSVDAEESGAAILDEQARRCLADAGKVQVAGLSGRVVAEIGERVGPAGGPAGPDQHRRSLRYPAVLGLPRQHVFGRYQVVGIVRRRFADVDHDAREDEPIQWDRRRVVTAFHEVIRCVEVCAAVLGGSELLGGIEVAAGRLSLGERVEPEAGRCRWASRAYRRRRRG